MSDGKIVRDTSDGKLVFFCPACGCGHWIDPIRWKWNGNYEKPTISPSILVRSVYLPPDADFTNVPLGQRHPDAKDIVCHSFVTDGKIQYLGDCTHEYAGQTIDLEEF